MRYVDPATTRQLHGNLSLIAWAASIVDAATALQYMLTEDSTTDRDVFTAYVELVETFVDQPPLHPNKETPTHDPDPIAPSQNLIRDGHWNCAYLSHLGPSVGGQPASQAVPSQVGSPAGDDRG